MALSEIHAATESYGQIRFSDAPRLVYWELTRACDLACRHCRAEAQPEPAPDELNAVEGIRLLHQLRGFAPPLPHLVLTGGDPLKRPDFFSLLRLALGIGFRTSVAPSATAYLKTSVLRRFRRLGIDSMSLSLDGSTPERHDGVRGIPGCFVRTVELAHQVGELGIPLQINTLVTAESIDDLPDLYDLLHSFPVVRWSLFFLVPVGRGCGLRLPSAADCERLFHWLYECAREAPFAVATTEAPEFRRVVLTKLLAEGLDPAAIRRTPVGRGFGIRDGNGVMFISDSGNVYPSGFFPVPAGNVRKENPVSLYRNSPLFRSLRETAGFTGRCGRCTFREICGGSRARAYVTAADPLGEDPLCLYQPNAKDQAGVAASGLPTRPRAAPSLE